jgi:hypothetical protein
MARQAAHDSVMLQRKDVLLHAGCLRKYRHTLMIFNTCCFAMATLVMRMHLIVMLYIHCLSCL